MTTAREITHEMELTRSDIRSTLSEIENRLSIDNVMQRIITPAKSGTIEVGRALGAAARNNPIAVGVTAVGLGWLILGQTRELAPRYRDTGSPRRMRMGDPRLDSHHVSDEASPMADLSKSNVHAKGGNTSSNPEEMIMEAKESVRAWGRDAADKVRDAADKTRETANKARSQLEDTTEQARSWAKETADQAEAWTKETAEQAEAWTRENAAQASETIRKSAQTVRKTVKDTGERLRRNAGNAGAFVREHPLAVGAVAVIAGVAFASLMKRRSSQPSADDQDDDDGAVTLSDASAASFSGGRPERGDYSEPTIPLMTTQGENLSASNAGDANVPPKWSDEAGAIPMPQPVPTSEAKPTSSPERLESDHRDSGNGSDRTDRAGGLN
ncbi:MAG: hypothetical protein WAS73_01840 [Defluviicoccus sp.]